MIFISCSDLLKIFTLVITYSLLCFLFLFYSKKLSHYMAVKSLNLSNYQFQKNQQGSNHGKC